MDSSCNPTIVCEEQDKMPWVVIFFKDFMKIHETMGIMPLTNEQLTCQNRKISICTY